MLKEIDNDGKQFSANEHSYLYEKLYSKNIFRTKESLLRYYLTKNYKKTLGCVAIKEKDMIVLLKLLNKRTKIKIF